MKEFRLSRAAVAFIAGYLGAGLAIEPELRNTWVICVAIIALVGTISGIFVED